MTEFLSTTRGDAVAYDLRGAGPAVIFVAGAGPHRATDPITTPTAVAAAERGLTTVVYDRLGRGESPAAGRIDLDRELAAIAALIERAGGGAVLCGHSSGCWISLAAAAAGLPVSGLVLWEAPGSESGGSNARWIAEVERRMDAGDLEGALRHYMKDMPPEWFEGARHSPDFADTLSLVPSFRADGEAMVWQQSAPLPELLRGVRVPLEAVVGEQTFPEMPDVARALADAVPGGVHRVLPGADHSWQPEPMAAELSRFVRNAKAAA
ncbi:MAG: alpha/beta hydrolase [Actinomycetota bacterium]|nr:alpha/beta hydrolase [Actinomycetota bacterium]